MAILQEEIPLVYTGDTQRFPPVAPTEQLSQASVPTERLYILPDARPWGVALAFFVSIFLILGACALVVRVGDHAFAVLAAFLVAGFIWLAFGRRER